MTNLLPKKKEITTTEWMKKQGGTNNTPENRHNTEYNQAIDDCRLSLNESKILRILKTLYLNKYFMGEPDEFADIMRAQAIVKEITK